MTSAYERFDAWLTGILVLLALAVCIRVWWPSPQPPLSVVSARPATYYQDWHSLDTLGHAIGDTAANIDIVEFGDFECPFCKEFHDRYVALKGQYGARLRLTFIEFPLSMHRFAMPSARAAECASRWGRFAAMYDVLYAKQDSLGLKSWASYAADAGVSDIRRFVRCTRETTPIPGLVLEGDPVAQAVGATGTPTLVINGWVFHGVTTDLDSNVARIALGKKPKSAM